MSVRNLRSVLPLLILLLGAALRLGALAQDTRFQPDEALFSTFARAAALDGRWLLPGALDKPPLAIYADALVMTAFAVPDASTNLPQLTTRAGEIAGRLPGALASILTIAVVYRLARRLYGPGATARTAMLLTALSPLAVAYGATAFTDGSMLMFTTAALWAIAEGRAGISGACMALAFACKQQALFYLPLVGALAWAQGTLTPRQIIRFVLPLAAGTALLVAWDAARAQTTGVWAQAAANNDPWRLIRANEIMPRLAAWAQAGAPLLGSAPVTAGLLALATFTVGARAVRQTRTRALLIDLLLLTYTLAYLLLHWLVAFNTFDRYLLPLLPPVALLAARGLAWLGSLAFDTASGRRRLPLSANGEGDSARGFHTGHDASCPYKNACLHRSSGLRLAGAALLLALLLAPAIDAARGQWAAGRGPQAVIGIDALADELNRRALGAIIYDHWLGWELDYYLGQWTDKRRVYYPTPKALADDALRQPDPAPRYFVVPADEPALRWLEALRGAGFTVALDYQSAAFVVYRLTPPTR